MQGVAISDIKHHTEEEWNSQIFGQSKRGEAEVANFWHNSYKIAIWTENFLYYGNQSYTKNTTWTLWSSHYYLASRHHSLVFFTLFIHKITLLTVPWSSLHSEAEDKVKELLIGNGYNTITVMIQLAEGLCQGLQEEKQSHSIMMRLLWQGVTSFTWHLSQSNTFYKINKINIKMATMKKIALDIV